MKEKFDVTGMTCSACSSRVEKCVSKLEGIENVSVNLLTNSMQVEYNDTVLSESQIIDAVVKAGYGASPKQEHVQTVAAGKAKVMENPMEKQIQNMKFRLIVSFVFLVPLMYVSMGHMVGLPLPGFLTGIENAVSFAFTQLLLCLPIIYVNRKYYIKGFQTLAHLAPNMDSLIAIGSTASLVYGIFAIYRMSYGLGSGNMEVVHLYYHDLYFESAAMILALITVGKYLETRSKGKTSEAITKLMDLAPKTAVVERDGREQEIPVEQVVAGDVVIVRPGQNVPVDGFILEGSTSIDEAAITGESIPVHKQEGDTVIAATMNKTGFVKFKATRVGDDTTFSQIIRLVEEASSSKAPIAKIADKIAGVFVPVVMVIALVTAVVWLLSGSTFEFALSCAISVLVISCPCALGLATPVAIMVGTGKGAEQGILIKSGEALETAHNLQSVVLDKTGTITQGRPVVTDIHTEGWTKKEFLALAAGMEVKSEHPLAEAILDYAKKEGISPVQVDSFNSIPGKGLEVSVNGRRYYAGNERLMREKEISLDNCLKLLEVMADEGKTPLIFAEETQVLGVIAVADVVKPTSKEAIKELKDLGIEVVMLTGDNRRTAEAIRRQLDIDTVIAEVLPQDKERKISELQEAGKVVAMIGDGVNDAPALARADVGMAIGAGTDVAIESADVVLMKNDLKDAVTAIRLSKAVIRNIKQNLFWAFFYNTLGIPIAAGIFYPLLGLKLNPMIGAAAMSMSSIFVVSNALRLKWFQPLGKSGQETQETVSAATMDDTPGGGQINQGNQEKEDEPMITMKIEGMMCQHCQAHVSKALNDLEGVKAEVSLEDQAAYVTADQSVDKEALRKAVVDAGYEVVSIEEK
ncbi:Copper-exporting P-type ATPase A [Blautia hydrogenotrophica]|uniref:heavy metal translocating P-type ATPase n=1 Tax=Blautia hydrogenotrophica TaxID=53443 RepID=UPI0006BF8A7D|nr:heavy metal translocating P-type ATPase [Blautia hydrogenotrophica]CUN16045.1 Copper-exporting P-type ATPase A [Blautia hydrogenotrophica]SCI25613.1 Copper-exporting P-type ATPase A [uncultured Blautia sp.]